MVPSKLALQENSAQCIHLGREKTKKKEKRHVGPRRLENSPDHHRDRHDIVHYHSPSAAVKNRQCLILKEVLYHVNFMGPVFIMLSTMLADHCNTCGLTLADQHVSSLERSLAPGQWHLYERQRAVQCGGQKLSATSAARDKVRNRLCAVPVAYMEKISLMETRTDVFTERLTDVQFESDFESSAEKSLVTTYDYQSLHLCTDNPCSILVNVEHPELLQEHNDETEKMRMGSVEMLSEEDIPKNEVQELKIGCTADEYKFNANSCKAEGRHHESKFKDIFRCNKSSIDLQNFGRMLLRLNPESLSATVYPVHVVRQVSSSLLLQRAVASRESASQIGLFRLATFIKWPKLGKLSALRCSMAGFYHTNTRDRAPGHDHVTCFSCGCTASQWTSGADPQTLHINKCRQHCNFAGSLYSIANSPHVRSSAADCPGSMGVISVAGRSEAELTSCSPVSSAVAVAGSSLTSQLIPKSSQVVVQSHTDTESNEEREKHENYRRSTFANVWVYDHIVDARELARNGFLYAGPYDRVRCAFCHGLLRNWEPGDRADEQHAKHFSYCRFVQGHDVGNVPIPFYRLVKELTTCTQSSNYSSDTEANLGITCEIPRCPDFAVEARRLLTYATWPGSHHLQPEALAKAGFFYLGKEDAVQCFFCDGILANWRTNCDPWVEHAQRFPTCLFLTQVQGHEFVRRHRENRVALPSSSKTSLAVDPREVRARMDSNKVRILLQMDYPSDLVREVVQRRLATDGTDHETSEQLLNSLFQTHDEKQLATVGGAASRREALPAEPIWTSVFSEDEIDHAAALTNNSSTADEFSVATVRKESTPTNALPTSGLSPDGCRLTPAVEPVFSSHQLLETSTKQQQTSRLTTATATVFCALAASAPKVSEANGLLAGNGALLTADNMSLGQNLRSEEVNGQLKTQLTCKVCMDELVGIVFLPCGHLVCCAQCAPALKACPICRVSIRGTVRTKM